MKLTLAAALALAALALPAAAQDAPPEGTAQSSAWHNQQQSALHSLTRADGWYILDGGVRFRRTAGDATGGAPTVRDVVSVNYTGRFADGQVFDSNAGRPPATFPLSRLIRAWQIAIPYMGIGDTAEIAVPMELGYGPEGGGPIPGGATLLFTIELLDVMRAPGG
jgi:FKBP-type peptidyl-prolyl cis-trans isomerase FkpA